MEVIHPRCCVIDIHKESVVACLRLQEGRRVKTEVRRFGTTTAELLRLHEWLSHAACTHVAMESTSVYLETGLQPPRGELRGSFGQCVPHQGRARPQDRREGLRVDREPPGAWTHPRQLHSAATDPRLARSHATSEKPYADRVKATNRVHKLLETANIKLANVVADVLGVSGRAMLDALVAGETDPEPLAKLAKGSLTPKVKPLAEALRSRFTSHHAFLLGQMLTQLDQLAALIARCDVRILEVSKPFEPEIQRLQTIVGVGRRSAEVLVSEIGVDMSRFSSAGHLASWARICPGSYESAGKRRSAGTGTGNNWLKTTLLESAWAAAHSRKSYLGAQFRRISKRRGPKRAGIAVAHSILVIAYHTLRNGVDFNDLGADYFDRMNSAKLKRYHLRRLAELGCDVSALAVSA